MNYWVARISSCPLWTRLSPATPPATALAAAEAAGMPVRRPIRPAAVSAADAAGVGPELGCAGQLERAAEAPIDEASSLWVGLSVDRSVDRSGLVGDYNLIYPGLIAFAGVRSPRRVLLSNHGQDFLASCLFFASLGRSAAVLVDLMYPGLLAFAGVRFPRRVFVCSRYWVWLGGVGFV